MRLRLFGYELIIQKQYFPHITHFPSKDTIEKSWQHDFPMEKRIRVMVKKHGFIEYIFRDLDSALFTYGDVAMQLLEDVIGTFVKIRSKLISKGATEEQIKIYDEKIQEQFYRLLEILISRQDKETYKELKKYDIKNYAFNTQINKETGEINTTISTRI